MCTTGSMYARDKGTGTSDKVTHAKISRYYSSKPEFAGGKTERDWLAGQSYEAQYQFGMDVLNRFGVVK